MQMMQKQTPQSAKSGFLGDRGSTTLVVGKQEGQDSFHITEPALVLQHLAYDSSIEDDHKILQLQHMRQAHYR